MFFRVATLAGFAAIARAHFVLQVPTSLGFDDGKESESPCGSFSATDRSTGVTDFPIAGAPIQMLTTHTSVTWDFKAALLSSPTSFSAVLPVVQQTGVGTFCLPQVPGNAAWVGQDAILQVIQHSPDGTLYQCAAIKFVSGSAASIPGSCVNSTGVTASFVGGGGASSSSPPSSATPLSTLGSSAAPSSAETSGSPSSGSPSSSTPGRSATGSAGIPITSAASTAGGAKASTTTAMHSGVTSKVNGTIATASAPAQFTGAAGMSQSADVFIGGLVAMLALAL
ncbi:uncharacterized protein BDR25DRAFT_254629 [Lindgomyces ingoldianus]|uniref:Uncharacterized protein n=1 Tax=Lindgomyces ingoldianus TaxID=673940 RepID=A0ACB6R8E7_9PLEO|nr:uncharacterized protein BDR25DRAFT_254629 [Lindgomyces ingoldianus]KAF2475594.1 hypothetical protein BDR25DRAFT_254629 [Lindgomyces ingoldianus]